MRKYRVEPRGKGYRVAQEESVEFDTPEELDGYIDRQERELERLLKQKATINRLETSLKEHISDLRKMRPKPTV
jgi:hypothetical protein